MSGEHGGHLLLPFDLAPSMAGGGLLGVLFLAGLLGGLSHCAGMCGPFVLAQAMAGGAAGDTRLARLERGARLPYHLGRMTTYTALGAAAGGVGGALMAIPGLQVLAAAFLAVAAAFFLLQGLRGLGVLIPVSGRGFAVSQGLGLQFARLLGPLFRDPRGGRGYALGLALGFLPCGLLYGALAAAASAGSAALGAAAMAAFAAGTMPALILVGVTGHWAARRWPRLMPRLAAALMVASAASVSVFAWQWVA